jgi:4'-phosphopantetheinyl transferase
MLAPPVSCVVLWARPRPLAAAPLHLLHPAERERLAALRREPDRERFATGRLLARAAIAQRTAAAPGAVVIDATCPRCGRQHGRPTTPGLELSIAHAGERVAVAISRATPVGVDVECGESLGSADGSALWPQVLAAEERDAIAALPPGRRREALLIVWTRKEALLKAAGAGLDTAMTTLRVSGADEPPALLASDGGLPAPDALTLHQLDAGAGYHAALAVLAPEPVTVEERWGDELLDGLATGLEGGARG